MKKLIYILVLLLLTTTLFASDKKEKNQGITAVEHFVQYAEKIDTIDGYGNEITVVLFNTYDVLYPYQYSMFTSDSVSERKTAERINLLMLNRITKNLVSYIQSNNQSVYDKDKIMENLCLYNYPENFENTLGIFFYDIHVLVVIDYCDNKHSDFVLGLK
jgi:hypothetical protein